jgi:hypothetical protein
MVDRKEERRGFVRVPFNTEVEVEANGKTVRSREEINLSMSGIRLNTNEAIPSPGSTCRVKILLQASDNRVTLGANGKVVWSAPGTLAVEFSDLDLESYHHLRNIILNNTDEPEKAEREFTSHWGIRPPRT